MSCYIICFNKVKLNVDFSLLDKLIILHLSPLEMWENQAELLIHEY